MWLTPHAGVINDGKSPVPQHHMASIETGDFLGSRGGGEGAGGEGGQWGRSVGRGGGGGRGGGEGGNTGLAFNELCHIT